MDTIRAIMEDTTLTPVEKVLFAILYCRREGNQCTLSVQQIVEQVGVQLESLQESLQGLEQRGFIRIAENCRIYDASSFLSCAVLVETLERRKPEVPRP